MCIPFAIDVKGEEKEVEPNDRGSMSISINDKGADCWKMLSLMSKGKQRVKKIPEMVQQSPKMGLPSFNVKDNNEYKLAFTKRNEKGK